MRGMHIPKTASLFDGGISKWDVSSVTSMDSMFRLEESFAGDISKWDVSSVPDMTNMHSRTKLNGDIPKRDASSVTGVEGTSYVHCMHIYMFAHAERFDGDLDLSKWDDHVR